MSQVTEQSVRFQTALASIKLIQASAVLDLTEDDFDFLTRDRKSGSAGMPRSEERFSRNAETDLVCRLLLEKKNLLSVKMGYEAIDRPDRVAEPIVFAVDSGARVSDVTSASLGQTPAMLGAV